MAHQSFEKLQVWNTISRQAMPVREAVVPTGNFAMKEQLRRPAHFVSSHVARKQGFPGRGRASTFATGTKAPRTARQGLVFRIMRSRTEAGN